jgi:DNA-binding beta-propeller fold protein YncE
MVIGSGFGDRSDPSALIIGPIGLAINSDGALFVADTLANRIAVIPRAATRSTNAGTLGPGDCA